MNQVNLIGNLGADPELRYTQGGQAVANFNIATNERWKDKDGNQKERTEWHKIVVWGKQAESCEKYLTKGRTVRVTGRLQTRDWQDKDGNTRYTTEVVANEVQFLSSGTGAGGSSSRSSSSSEQTSQQESWVDDDIPF